MVMVPQYQALKDVLISGDVVFLFAARQPDPSERETIMEIMRKRQQQQAAGQQPGTAQPPGGPAQPMVFFKTVFDEGSFSGGLAALDAIHDSRVRKTVCLSSIEDLKANLTRLPKDIRWVAYNMEPQMTPREELQDPGKAVVQFAKVCHDNGLKLNWVPGGFRMFEDEKKLSPIAPSVDAIVLQQQHELQQQGVDTFVTLARKRTTLIKKLNPKCEVYVQVVIGRGSNEDLVKALKAISSTVDGVVLWTMKDTDTLKEILRAIR
jgi:hypothetical protein